MYIRQLGTVLKSVSASQYHSPPSPSLPAAADGLPLTRPLACTHKGARLSLAFSIGQRGPNFS